MRKLTLLLALFVALTASARRQPRHAKIVPRDTLAVRWQQYADSLQLLLDRYQKADSLAKLDNAYSTATNPYYFPLLAGGTLYNRPLQQMMGIDWKASSLGRKDGLTLGSFSDARLSSVNEMDRQMALTYVKNPSLFLQTQDQLMSQGALRSDVEKPIESKQKMSDQIQLADIEHDVTDTIVAITRRPNFWTLKGSASLQFTQAYFSDNWFQGGDNNYSALSLLTIEANYDNKQKIQWENKLELQLGFQTAKSDTCHSLKVTSNLLRLTSKLGYQAAKSWYYTTQFQTYTQLYPNYVTNSNTVTTDFASPLYASLSIGMDYKLKKKRFNGSLYLSPVSVNLRYVDRELLRSRYNDNADQVTKWNWGPNVTINYTWDIVKNVQWQSRLYWFSDFHYTNIEWENTFSFTINRFLSCKLFAYPKYLDNNVNYKTENGSYWMFKEWLSLGVSYSW